MSGTLVNDELEQKIASNLDSLNLKNAVGICFNLYEEIEHFGMQVVTTTSYDAADDEWPCDELETTDIVYRISRSIYENSWEKALSAFHLALNEINIGKYLPSNIKGAAVGFVDGDLKTVSIST
jgi:hypothetical protein